MSTERRDVVRNRAALVAAAEQVFAARGVTAPLSEVAREAGVGRATLNRHFPERYLLAGAVYDQHLDDVEMFAARHAGAPGGVALLVRRIVDGQRQLAGLFPLMRSAPAAADRLDALGSRLATIFRTPLSAAQEREEIDRRVTVDDLQLVLAMAEGLLASFDGDELDWAVERSLTVTLAALRPGVIDEGPRPRPTQRE